MILGLDVSFNQPPDFPWPAAVAWGARFAIIRAGGGRVEDEGYPKHRERARAAQLWTGTYWDIYPWCDPAESARHFVSLLMDDDELPAFIDVEVDGVTALMLAAFVAEFKRQSRRRLGIYSSANKWHALIGRGQTQFAALDCWLANGNFLIDIWPKPLFVQAWPAGSIPGYDADLDLDEFAGSEADWQALTGANMTNTDDALKLIEHAMADLVQAHGLLAPPAPQPVQHWYDALPSGVLATPYTLGTPPAPITMRDKSGAPLAGVSKRQNAMQMFERVGNLARVVAAPINGALWWIDLGEWPAPAG